MVCNLGHLECGKFDPKQVGSLRRLEGEAARGSASRMVAHGRGGVENVDEVDKSSEKEEEVVAVRSSSSSSERWLLSAPLRPICFNRRHAGIG